MALRREPQGQGGVEPWGGFLGKTLRGQTEASRESLGFDSGMGQ